MNLRTSVGLFASSVGRSGTQTASPWTHQDPATGCRGVPLTITPLLVATRDAVSSAWIIDTAWPGSPAWHPLRAPRQRH
jgi:hypothetical protein